MGWLICLYLDLGCLCVGLIASGAMGLQVGFEFNFLIYGFDIWFRQIVFYVVIRLLAVTAILLGFPLF